MEQFSIIKLWNLRAELDETIASENYGQINKIEEKYRALVDKSWCFERAFICYNSAFWTISERQSHNFQNVLAILTNIENHSKFYLNGEQVSTKLKTARNPDFLAGEIWILRAMYDKFLSDSKKTGDARVLQQNMILGKAIIEKLQSLTHKEELDDYYQELVTLIKEVRESYECIYGKNQPRLTYNQIAEEYLEK